MRTSDVDVACIRSWCDLVIHCIWLYAWESACSSVCLSVCPSTCQNARCLISLPRTAYSVVIALGALQRIYFKHRIWKRFSVKYIRSWHMSKNCMPACQDLHACMPRTTCYKPCLQGNITLITLSMQRNRAGYWDQRMYDLAIWSVYHLWSHGWATLMYNFEFLICLILLTYGK